jgi:DNA-binding MarR family transcriptional regulator
MSPVITAAARMENPTEARTILLARFFPDSFMEMATETLDHVDRILLQWRDERPELDTTAMGVVGRLIRAARLAEEELQPPLRERGFEAGWFDLLAALRRAGPPYELNPTRLMDAVMLSSGGMTKRLDQVERAGLVERRPDPNDRRGTLVRLTPRGKRAIDRAVPVHIAGEERLLDSLNQKELRMLDGLLRKVLIRLEEAR